MDTDPWTLDVPRFCPRCARARPPGDELCAECGERLAAQGYCGVCERHWRLPVGAECPKHEIPLEAEIPRIQEFGGEGTPVSWVTVARFEHPAAAMAARLRLEAEEIPTFLDGERMSGDAAYNLATGGVRLQVPSSLVDEARVLLSQTWSVPGDEDDLDDAYESLAPAPGEFRRTVMKVAIVAILGLPLLIAIVESLLRRRQ